MSSEVTDPALAAVQVAVDAGEFRRARELLEGVREPVSAARLDLEGRAAYGDGDVEATLTAYEQLHRFHLERGAHEDAAMAAVTVAMHLMMDTGLMAPLRAWLARAERLVGDQPDSPVWAWFALVQAYERLMCGDLSAAGDWAQRAIDEGERLGVAPPAIVGRVALGRSHIHEGRLDEGLRLLDEAALEASTGMLDPITTGQVWCEVICAMQWVGHHDRAEEWTVAMEAWRDRAAFGSLSGRCRLHRAEILRMRGPCDAAEQEALLACEELRPWMRREYGWPLTELGNVRYRKGDFAGAEEAYLAAHQNAWSPEPGLALLRLTQGRVDEAMSLIRSALDHPFDIPSKERPPSGGLRRAPLLEAQVQIALAAGEPATAEGAAAELGDIADTFRSRTLQNAALSARGRIALHAGRVKEAIGLLRTATMEWADLRVPFETAQVRLQLAAALRAGGDDRAAELEVAAACGTFEELGASAWVALARDGESGATTPVSAERCVFRCDGDMRTITFAGDTVLLKDLKGMRYLERLLAEPGREFHALDLVSVERGALPVGRGIEGDPVRAEMGLEIFDSKARDAYRRRLEETEADIAEAESHNDYARATLARADRQFLIDELARGVGLDGRDRIVGGGAERARTSATRSVRYALARIAKHHALLAEHLERTIRTGTYFAYEPDPRASPSWEC